MYIPQGCKLTIEAGAQVHFTPYKLEIDPVDAPRFYRYYSMLQIAGTLEIKGEAGNPVVLQQTRLQTLPQPLYDYTESPDQWAGIWITTSAQNNIIEHALIKNANIGIRVDSASVNGNPKLTVKYTKVRNMGAYGVLGNFYDDNVRLGNAPAIHMENSSISSCAINTVVIARGGWYDFFNCTFDNTTRTTSKDPTVTVLNAYKDADDVVHGPFDIKTRFVNCAITGKNKHELLLGLLEGGNKQVVCDHSFVKIDDAEYNYDAYFQSVSKNQDVRYNDPYKFDFRPKLGSPLINAGTETFDNTPLPYNWDIRGRADSARTAPYDVGAYEYFEI
jgi:hypothetical protein